MSFPLTLVGLRLLLWIPPLSAQPSSDWASLGRTPTLSAGAEIQVRTTDGKRDRGRFQSASDDAWYWQLRAARSGSLDPRIAHVSVGRKSFCFLGNNFGNAISTPMGALIGVLIAALLPGRHEVYRAR
jgi:hypothetical protein